MEAASHGGGVFVKRAGRIVWNVMAIIGILAVTSIVLTVAGLVAVVND